MNLRPIIEDIALMADDFITERTDRTKALAEILDFVTLEHPCLTASDRKRVANGVLAALENDDFFPNRFVDSFDPDQNPEDSDTD